ncbi:MAG TPA: MAPEG family protein [Stellaceae bacterium]|nr:MAPEG family protein [Stellaceae bacterium]
MITALYAGILAIIGLVLAMSISRMRGSTKTGIGSGGNPALERMIRAHGNFTEYVPLILVLMLLMEAGGASHLWLHIMGIVFVIARLAHAYGLSMNSGTSPARLVGASLTYLVLLSGIIGTLSVGIHAL